MMSIKYLLFSVLLVGAVQAEDAKDLSKHNCCLHIKDASDAWWMTNPDITKEVCKSYYKDVAQFDSKTGTCNEHKNGMIKDADWKSKCKIYGTSLGWTDDRVGAGHVTASAWCESLLLPRGDQPSTIVSDAGDILRTLMGRVQLLTHCHMEIQILMHFLSVLY
ncbi:hypothetical protein ACKLNR_011493 [Fusarium oxysporum f. sp. zingiberi]